MQENRAPFAGLNGQLPEELFGQLKTPCYILDEEQLRYNGEILAGVAKRTKCRILLAQKAFSNFAMYPVLAPYLAGTAASGLYEARLGFEEMKSAGGKKAEVHVFCGAYREDEFEELLTYADHIVFNSINQLKRFGSRAKAAGKAVGLRINPECSTQEGHKIYDPCAPGSRLGTTRSQWNQAMTPELIALLDGLHFHTLCEQDSDALEITLKAVDEKYGDVLSQMKWVNFGGGHHITRPDYDIERLERCIRWAQDTWKVSVYLEPGEACALNAGYLATRVMDTFQNGTTKIAMLDMSAACHTPDVIEMPYKPPLYGEIPEELEEADCDVASKSCDEANEGGRTVVGKLEKQVYRLGGPTCLAGDVLGDFAFDHPLEEGELLLFGDMAIYSTCKNNTFNGMPLPSIYRYGKGNEISLIKAFGYEDFKGRLS